MRILVVSLPFVLVACSGGALNFKGKTSKECPQISVRPDTINFVDGRLGLPAVQSFEIFNECASGPDLELDIQFVPSTSSFSLEQFDEVIPANGQGSVSVQFNPLAYSEVSTVIELRSNDPNESITTVELKGTVAPDQDGDGVDAQEAGGIDCDDANAQVYPGADEVYYDGVDSDCDGWSDFDQDRDGYDRMPEGDDCDDTSVLVHPGIREVQNLLDDDCDGLADEDWLMANMIRITEVMIDPQAVFDSSGEWIELLNASEQAVNVLGWTLSDGDGEQVVISESVIVSSGETLVIGNNGEPASNGGVEIDYAYDGTAFHLDNQADEVELRAGDLEMDELRYDADWPLMGGAALMLDAWLMDNGADGSLAQHWCASSVIHLSGDFGSPGAANGYCQTIDHDGDGYTELDGDCDDFDVTVSPDKIDRMNGIDDDCDGRVDDTDILSIYGAKLEGPSAGAYLGGPNSLSIADLTNDGSPEVIVGTPLRTSSGGEVYLLQGPSVYSLSGTVSTHATSIIESPGSSYSAFGRTPEVLADNTGDGVVDLLVVGSRDYSSDSPHAALFSGGGVFSSSMDPDDATMIWTGSEDSLYYQADALSAKDFNGDGAAEVLLGYPNNAYYTGAVGLFQPSGMSAGEYDITDADWLLSGGDSYQFLGSHVNGADVDDDGYDDMLLCGRGYRWSTASTYANAACFLVMGRTALGTEDDVDDMAQVKFTESFLSSAEYGSSTAFGDIDDDGTLDIVVAAAGRDTLYVYLDAASLSGTVRASDANYSIEGWTTPQYFGQSLSFGDVNNDGIDDLVVGAPDIGTQLSYAKADEAGVLYVFEGGVSRTGTQTEADAGWTVSGDDVGDGFGYEVRLSDVDADGDVDLMVSAPADNSLAGVLYFVDLAP